MTRIDAILRWLVVSLLAAVVLVQAGISRGRDLEAQEIRHTLHLDLSCERLDVGEYLYLRQPARLLDAIRTAEGVPSYGIMPLARAHGGHSLVPEEIGRRAAAALLHAYYRRWVAAGRPQTFLGYLANRYAPIGAANDPMNANAHWLPNLLAALEVRD